MTDGDNGFQGKCPQDTWNRGLPGGCWAAAADQEQERQQVQDNKGPEWGESSQSLGAAAVAIRVCMGTILEKSWAKEGRWGCSHKAHHLHSPTGKWLLFPTSKEHSAEGQHGHHYQGALAHFPTVPLWKRQDRLTLTISSIWHHQELGSTPNH